MRFLSSLRPLLRGSASVSITLTATQDAALSVVVMPKLDRFDPETSDAARAALQAALARPIRLVIPADADADAEFAAALDRINDVRAPVVDDLRDYLDALSQAQQTAKIETAKKDAKKATDKDASKKSSASPSKQASASAPPHTSSPEGASGEDEGELSDAAASADTPATSTPPAYASAADAISPASPTPAAAASLFD